MYLLVSIFKINFDYYDLHESNLNLYRMVITQNNRFSNVYGMIIGRIISYKHRSITWKPYSSNRTKIYRISMNHTRTLLISHIILSITYKHVRAYNKSAWRSPLRISSSRIRPLKLLKKRQK